LPCALSFGDRKLKQFVSAEPEIKSWPLSEGDDFLILASDGVWDVLSSQAAVDIVRQSMSSTGGDVKHAAERLTNAAYSYHSMDNITSMVRQQNVQVWGRKVPRSRRIVLTFAPSIRARIWSGCRSARLPVNRDGSHDAHRGTSSI